MKKSERIIANILLIVCTVGLLIALIGNVRQRTNRNRVTFYIEQPQNNYQQDNPSPYYAVPVQPTNEPVYST